MQFVDFAGNTLNFEKPVSRIISLVPSYTQTLFEIGAGDKVVGRTKYCIHPNASVSQIPVVGGTKQIKDLNFIQSLQPDLILCNKEENTQEMVSELAEITQVWVSEIQNLEDNNSFLSQLGKVTNCEEKAEALIQKINDGFNSIPINTKNETVLYLIWRNPFMAAASGTFIDFVLKTGGFTNVLKELNRYPTLELETIFALNPDVVMLSSEPYPFKTKHIREIQKLLPNAKIMLVDGERFSWHGSGIVNTPAYLKSLRNQL